MNTPSATRVDLLLMGLLLDRPMHGYELYQKIQAKGIDTWFNVSTPGVYYSLGKLHEQELVAETRQREGRSARKSIYRLTEKGRSAFFAAMEAQLASQENTYLDHDVVIYLLNRLPLQRVIPLLEQHQARLAAEARQVQADLGARSDEVGSSLRLAILDHKSRLLETERAWVSDLIGDIEGKGAHHETHTAKRRGLMVLEGELRYCHLPDLILFILSGRHSGTLTVTDDTYTRTLVFEEGQPTCASLRGTDDRPAEPPTPERVTEGLRGLFRLQEGRFTFDQESDCGDGYVRLDIDAEELILCGCRGVDDYAIIQRLIPTADTVFEMGAASQRLERLTLIPIEERILDAVDGIRDVATIARELELTVFEASRAFYGLVAVGVVRTADPDKSRLRRVFREIAELMCSSTVAWRLSPDDRSCEEEVNRVTPHLPLCLSRGRIQDRADPQLDKAGLVRMYRSFLLAQLDVVGQRFGEESARRSFKRTLRQLAPELQSVAKRYGLDTLLEP